MISGAREPCGAPGSHEGLVVARRRSSGAKSVTPVRHARSRQLRALIVGTAGRVPRRRGLDESLQES